MCVHNMRLFPKVNQFLQLVKNVYCELPKTVVSPSISALVIPNYSSNQSSCNLL